MLRRAFFLALLFVLLTPVALYAQAPDSSPVFCGDLPEADCRLLQNSQSAMLDVHSGAMEMVMDLTLEGVPEIPSDQPFMRIVTTLTLAGTPDTVDAVNTLRTTPAADLLQDPDALAALLQLATADLDVVSTSKMNEEIFADVDEEVTTARTTATRMVNGFVYINADAWADVAPWLGDFAQWYGFDSTIFQEMQIRDALESGSVDELLSQVQLPGEQLATVDILALPHQDVVDYGRLVRITPLRSHTEDGQRIASYHINFSPARFLGSPGFRALVDELSADAELRARLGLSADQVRLLAGLAGWAGAVLTSGLDADMQLAVGAEDALVRSVDGNFRLDTSHVARLLGEESQVVIRATLHLTNSDLNQVGPIEPPADAFVLPIRTVMDLVENMRQR